VKKADFAAWVAKYYDDPLGFVMDMWDVDPYRWQRDVMGWVAGGERRIAVPTGHGVGKTALMAWLAIWFVLTRFPCKVVVTAPSSSTLEDGLWAEIEMWVGRLPSGVKALLEAKSDRVELRLAPESAFISSRTSRAEKPEALAGIHADHVLLLPDESSGIPDEVFSAAQGSMSAATAQTVMAGNPTRATGYFAEAVSLGRDLIWKVREVSCLEVLDQHPNAPTQAFVDEIKLLYGENSNTYRARVEGKLPLSDEDVVIPRLLIDESLTRDVAPSLTAPLYWGLDVARLGRNQSALAQRRGNHMPEPVIRFTGLDTMALCGRVKAMYDGLPPSGRPVEILIDGIGLGAGVVDRLRELGLPAVGINVSERKSHDNAYYNLKAELWYTARAWFASLLVKMVADPELIIHLSTPKPEKHSSGVIIMEPKEKTLKRMGRGEERRLDDADAFILTFAGQAAAAAYGSDRGTTWNQPISRNRKVLA
jgi:hypothetical protein